MSDDRKQGPGPQKAKSQDLSKVGYDNNAGGQLQARRLREARARQYNQEHAKEAASFRS